MRAWITRAGFVVALVAAGFALARPAGLGLGLGAVAGLAAALAACALEAWARRASTSRVAGAAAGLACGLAIAALARLALGRAFDGLAQPLLGALVTGALAFAGAAIASERFERLRVLDGSSEPVPARAVELAAAVPAQRATPAKIVDTSVIIDGRIADVIEAGFVEGAIVIPQFILRELQQVADSSDPLKRNRGRKGLDVLRALQASSRVTVEFTSEDTHEVREVDAKLLWLAERRSAAVLTNDYNLNKIAQLRGIDVLNVNDLANAVRPVVLPGEALTIQVIKEGKERNQGVGYLDDGTMVVVENGRRLLGQKLDVLVTSVIQTNAGKMIFATAEDDETPEVRPRVLRRVPERDVREPPGAASVVSDN